MTDSEQISAFVSEMHKLIDRFRAEYDLPVASILGAIECVKLELFVNEKNDQDEK